jgi:hypothetical protein
VIIERGRDLRRRVVLVDPDSTCDHGGAGQARDRARFPGQRRHRGNRRSVPARSRCVRNRFGPPLAERDLWCVVLDEVSGDRHLVIDIGESEAFWLAAHLQGDVLLDRSKGVAWSSPGDPLLAKSVQSVRRRPWPGLTASPGLLKSAEIRARWCQPWVSPIWRPSCSLRSGSPGHLSPGPPQIRA